MLDVAPDARPFNEFIAQTPQSVVSFKNLGKDALLVVPVCKDNTANYCHLASFTHTAPIEQQHMFWKEVGEQGLALASDRPVWLSTAGGGVDWLHVRFDSRPKYFHYNAFRNAPNS